MSKNKKILIGVPCFNEENNLLKLNNELEKIVSNINNFSFEILYVDDGSNDSSWKKIHKLTKDSKYVSGAKFSKNFGKEAAIKFMIDYANDKDFDFFITIDADLQHPPKLILKMIKISIENKIDKVLVIKDDVNLGIFRKFFTNIFYGSFNFFSNKNFQIKKFLSDYSIINKKIIKEMSNITDNLFVYKAYLQWIGFKSYELKSHINVRYEGSSKFGFYKLFKLALVMFINYNPSFIIKFAFISSIFIIIFNVLLIIIFNFYNFDLNIHKLSLINFFLWFFLQYFVLSLYQFSSSTNLNKRPLYILEEKCFKSLK